MISLGIFDIPFLSRAIVVSSIAPPTRTDILYDLSGSEYQSGSYDIFTGYYDGAPPTNMGYGWNGSWVFEQRMTRILSCADVLLEFSGSFPYPSGSAVSESNYGCGWSGSWDVIEGT